MNRETLRTGAPQTGGGFLILDQDFRIQRVDSVIANLVDLDPGELVGQRAEIILDCLSGDLDAVQQAIDGTGPPTTESTLILTAPDDEPLPLLATVEVTRSGRRFGGLRMHLAPTNGSTPTTATPNHPPHQPPPPEPPPPRPRTSQPRTSPKSAQAPTHPAPTRPNRLVPAPTSNPPPSTLLATGLRDPRQSVASGGLVSAIQRFGSRFDFHAMAAYRVAAGHLHRVALWISPGQTARAAGLDAKPLPVPEVLEAVMTSVSSGPQSVEGLDARRIAELLDLNVDPEARLDVLATRLDLDQGGILLGIRHPATAQLSLNFQRTIRDLSWLVTQLVARRDAEEALTTQLRLQETLRSIATRFLSTAPAEKSETLQEALWQLGTSMGARRLSVWQTAPGGEELRLEAQYASGELPIASRTIHAASLTAAIGDRREPVSVLARDLSGLQILTTRSESALNPGDRITVVPLGDERQMIGYMMAVIDSPASRSAAHASGLSSLGSLLATFLTRLENEERFERAFADGPIPVTWRRPSGELLRCNNAFLKFIGQDSEYALLGSTLDAVVDTGRVSTNAVTKQLESPNPTELPFLRSDGAVAWGRVVNFRVRSGGETIVLSHIADTTASHKITQQLQHQATHDELTGLKNRRGLLEALDELHAFNGAKLQEDDASVLLIDVDRFKVINDSLGHAAGDQLLLELARRLLAVVGEHHICSRLGGDEFVVVLNGPVSAETAKATANELLSSLSGSVQLGEHEVFTSISIGIAFPHPADSSPSDLLRHADAAMYEAKNNGRNCFSTFDPRTRKALASRNSAEMELRRAIENGEFVPFYQPEYDLVTGQIVGAEALVRWPHPRRGVLAGDSIIPLAEETGLIAELGTQILNSACASAAAWSKELGTVPFGLRVNISASQLDNFDVIDTVVAAMMKSNLQASQLCLEVTETALMRDPKQALRILNILVREIGVSIAVDDFGTGFSSLAYLKRLPVRTLKIDREFVHGVGTNDENTAIVKTIVALAESLRLEVVAEGIEDDAALRRLVTLGVTRGQGYYLAMPLPQDQFADRLLGEQRPSAGGTGLILELGEPTVAE